VKSCGSHENSSGPQHKTTTHLGHFTIAFFPTPQLKKTWHHKCANDTDQCWLLTEYNVATLFVELAPLPSGIFKQGFLPAQALMFLTNKSQNSLCVIFSPSQDERST
jgi:hypothetical protein